MWGRIDSRRPRLDKQDNFDFPFGPSPQKSILLLCPIKTFWMDNNVLGNIAIFAFIFLGYPRLRICLKSSTTAASKTYDTSQSSCRHSYSMPVALLCCRREFLFRGHLEDSHDTSKVPSAVSIVLLFLLRALLIHETWRFFLLLPVCTKTVFFFTFSCPNTDDENPFREKTKNR